MLVRKKKGSKKLIKFKRSRSKNMFSAKKKIKQMIKESKKPREYPIFMTKHTNICDETGDSSTSFMETEPKEEPKKRLETAKTRSSINFNFITNEDKERKRVASEKIKSQLLKGKKLSVGKTNTDRIKPNMDKKRTMKQTRLKNRLMEGPEALADMKKVRIVTKREKSISELDTKMKILNYDTEVLKKSSLMFRQQLKRKILENRNICSKNKDLFTLVNNQQIQISKLLSGVRQAPESRLVTDSRYKVTFYDSKKDRAFKERMKELKEKYDKTREFNFDINHVWDDFINEDQFKQEESSRSEVDSSISSEVERKQDKTKDQLISDEEDSQNYDMSRMDTSLYSMALKGNLSNNTGLNNFFKKNEQKSSSSNFDRGNMASPLTGTSNLSNLGMLITPKMKDYYVNDSGIEGIKEVEEDGEAVFRKPVYGVDYTSFEHFENQDKVIENYNKKVEVNLIKEIFDLMILKGKIPKVFKDEVNLNIRVVLIKRYCYL